MMEPDSDPEPCNDDAATDDDTETVYAYCSRCCDMCGGFLAFEMCLEDFNDDMSIDHGEPNESENDANESEPESQSEPEPELEPEPEPEQAVSNVEDVDDDTEDVDDDEESEDDESENENEDDEDAVAVGCPNPRNPKLRWYKCALCPKMDFCATCYLTHEHQCAPGPCHAADDRCHNCAQDVDEDLPSFIPVVFSRPKRPTPQLSS